MLRYFQILIFILLSQTVLANEVANPVFDNRHWVLGWSGSQPNGNKTVFDEYVLPGESVHHWSELLTIQFFPGLNQRVTLAKYEELNKKGLQQKCPDIKWQTIYQKPTERMWEWSIKNCRADTNQAEIVRVVTTQQGLHVFHYAIKKSPMPSAQKSIWVKNLQAIKIKNET